MKNVNIEIRHLLKETGEEGMCGKKKVSDEVRHIVGRKCIDVENNTF